MLTALLAAARDGQRRPSARDAFDLLRNGLAVRADTFGHAERARARVWTGLVSAGALSCLITLIRAVSNAI